MAASSEDSLEDDIIIDLMNWSIKLMFTKASKQIAMFMFGLLTLEICIGTYVFLSTWDIEFWIKYFVVAIGCCAPFWCYVILFFKQSEYHSILNETFKNLWPLKSAGPHNFTKLEKEGKFAKYFMIFMIILSQFSAASGLPLFSNNYDIFLPVKLSVDYLGKWALPYLIIFYASLSHMGFTIVSTIFVLLYLVLHLKFQYFLLNKRLEEIECNSRDLNLRLINQTEYQDGVRQELVLCIQHHQRLITFGNRINDLIYYPIFCFTGFGVLAYVCMIFYLSYYPEFWFRASPLVITAICVTVAFCFIGQLLENESAKVFTLLSNLPWYNWNLENTKIILLFLNNSQEPITLTSSGLITMNFQLLIGLYRTIYTTVTFFLNFKEYIVQ